MSENFKFQPRLTLLECHDALVAPGRLFEIETATIQGRSCQVWKNLWPNIRSFWIQHAKKWSERPYLVSPFGETWTYQQVFNDTLRVAAVFRDSFGVRKGDRVAIASLNCTEYILCVWASHLIGAVPTHINTWIPVSQVGHCLKLTQPKIFILEPAFKRTLGSMKFTCPELLINSTNIAGLEDDHTPTLKEMLARSKSDGRYITSNFTDLNCVPDDPALILFTSGTTSLPKAVLSSQRGVMGNVFNALYSAGRMALREGLEYNIDDPLPSIQKGDPQKVALLAAPLFHVVGCNSVLMYQSALGSKLVVMRKWDKVRGVEKILSEGVTALSCVASVAYDVLDAGIAADPEKRSRLKLEGLGLGGGPIPDTLPQDFARAHSSIVANQGYGLTETNAIACIFGGKDYRMRPKASGLTPPTSEIIVVETKTEMPLPPGKVGEIWIRGSVLMTEYYNDPVATKKAITPEGWFKSGDLGYLDEEGFVYVSDRAKDIIIRGGENIHSVTIENALYANPSILEAAAVAVPDRRLGELVAAVVTPTALGKGLTEKDVMEDVKKKLVPHMIPVMILVKDTPLERNPSGKVLKNLLRKEAAKEWKRRSGSSRVKTKL